MTPSLVVVEATTPVRSLPAWALLERRLFALQEEAWRLFERRFCEPDGSLRYHGRMYGRDGVDDFYEPFFNWPTLYRLGGSDALLAAAKRHWEGVTAQQTAFGFVRDEYELGYDWFHQAESLGLFLAICAADPDDERFRERAERFAGLYLPGSPLGNYDAERRMIVAPHTGSGGPRWGVGEDWEEYRADQDGMAIYGLPLHDLPGIESWDDLRRPEAARAMGAAMQERMGRGDTAIDLAATTLAANAWLYGHDERFSRWLLDYVDAWRERAAQNDGILPDNVGPSGRVGELHGGAWYGGHYGWTWPHGLHSIEPAAAVAALNATLVTGTLDRLDLARGPLDAVLAEAVVLDDIEHRGSLGPGWARKLGATPETRELLVPYRYGPDGWFDLHPLALTYPMWLAWASGSAEDRARLDRLREASPTDWTEVRWFRDKEEQGHEGPWLAYLDGDAPDYPARALEMAIGQVLHRMALIEQAPDEPEDGDIHFWQRLNPVATEILSQLITGAPPAIYYGGLAFARVVLGDGERGRPGLPDDVAALVSAITPESVTLELVNTGSADRLVVVQAGAFGEDRVEEVRFDRALDGYPGSDTAYDIPAVRTTSETAAIGAPSFAVRLPARTRITLDLRVGRRAERASHTRFRSAITPSQRSPE
ncbi:hypothetical protein P5G50_08845 [Leifsonia sp. F6_8S_P_1B]|uniref:Uncharacterized protein n=1 Tax=Leifsonia williamsii TaxID=3035919 RepID=A0ABT8KAT2_9MICO|nr:hypothetical protein [Leifsonia williamsii]MDN4614559.1 hypothetical protein [Leifsonia williamsii]